MTDRPDLSSARVFAEAARPDAVDRWYVMPGSEVVWYVRRPGEPPERSIIQAETIIGRDVWVEVTGGRG